MTLDATTRLADEAEEFCDPHHDEMKMTRGGVEVCSWCDFEEWPCKVQRLTEAHEAWKAAQ